MRSLFLIIISLFIYACHCIQEPVFPVPDKIKYNSIFIESLQTFVVRDTVLPKFDQVYSDTNFANLIKPQLTALIEQEQINTIDFKDNLFAAIKINSNGQLVKSYDTDYTPYFNGIDFVGTPNNDYVRLFINSSKYSNIPYFVSFFKKQGSSQISGFTKTSEYYQDHAYTITDNTIKLEDLRVNDTIYINRISVQYIKY